MSSVTEVVSRGRLVVCVGPGGVGKTTVAAAIAARAARDGKRVFLLTIDPARRLADALGLSLGDAESEVPIGGAGVLYAAMLETRSSWDEFVSRMAPDPGVQERIMGNRVYRAFSRTLARSHAYVAMERLHRALTERTEDGELRWDLVVLDTPPTRSALEIIDAPSNLERFLGKRSLPVFSLEGRGATFMTRVLGQLMGSSLVSDLFQFFGVFMPLKDGFAMRASEIRAHLLGGSAAFVLVVAPSAAHLHDAAFLAEDLESRGVRLSVVIMNRAYHPLSLAGDWTPEEAIALLTSAPDTDANEILEIAHQARDCRERAMAENTYAESLLVHLLERARLPRAYLLPITAREPCSISELLALIDGIETVRRHGSH